MATIKTFTDISQSKTLSKILPLESADMYWFRNDTETPEIYPKNMMKDSVSVTLPCWSLAGLLGVLPINTTLLKGGNISNTGDIKYHCEYGEINTHSWHDNPIDACYEMIIRLNELNLL